MSYVPENPVAQEIVDAAFKVHTTLGPGLLESVYETVLAYELKKRAKGGKATAGLDRVR